jgi:hypothetical protein
MWRCLFHTVICTVNGFAFWLLRTGCSCTCQYHHYCNLSVSLKVMWWLLVGGFLNSQCINYVAVFPSYFYLHRVTIAPTCLQLVYSMFIAIDLFFSYFSQHSSPLCCLVLCTLFIVWRNAVLIWNTMPASALWKSSEYVVFVNGGGQWNIRWNNRNKASSSKSKSAT